MRDIIIAIIGSGAFSGVVGAALAAISGRRRRYDGIAAGTRTLLYDRIKHLGRRYIAAGCVSAEDLEDLIAMHRVYHDELDGNGFLDAIMQKVRALPVRERCEPQ